MQKTGVSIDNRKDVEITAGNYISSEEWLATRIRAGVTIQCWFRQRNAREHFRKMQEKTALSVSKYQEVH